MALFEMPFFLHVYACAPITQQQNVIVQPILKNSDMDKNKNRDEM